MSKITDKKILKGLNKKILSEFFHTHSTTDCEIISLASPSILPNKAMSSKPDKYEKIRKKLGDNGHELRFIKKNSNEQGFVWQTTNRNLKKALRWGILHTESLTGKAISTLGKYRLVAFERITKGFISNTHRSKINMIDVFQKRIEGLQVLESLINTNASVEDITKAIDAYTSALVKIRENISSKFSDTVISRTNLVNKLSVNIDNTIHNANRFKIRVLKSDLSKPFTKAYGNRSILEFVRSEINRGLYNLQGINQDLTYNRKRRFAATRGELNSFIEDTKKVVDDYQGDFRNAVLSSHQARFSNNDDIIDYSFINDHLSAEDERKAVMAISFIEGCDSLSFKGQAKARISNHEGVKKNLKTTASTNWTNYRSFKGFFKRLGHGAVRILKSIFIKTRPWSGDPWHDGTKLYTHELQKLTTPILPLWKKPWGLLKTIGKGFVDLFKGVKETISNFTIDLYNGLAEDWSHTGDFDWQKEKNGIEARISELKNSKFLRTEHIKEEINDRNYQLPRGDIKLNPIVGNIYHLSTGEQNDILTAISRGLNDFVDVFTHDIYAKRPVSAIVFTLVGLGCTVSILAPEMVKKLGPEAMKGLVDAINKMGNALGSSPLMKAASASLSSANVATFGFEALLNGPNSMLANVLSKLSEDPLTPALAFSFAYAIGWALTNGVGKLSIPKLHEYLKKEMGEIPELSYPLVGGKVSVLFIEAFMTHTVQKLKSMKSSILDIQAIDKYRNNQLLGDREKMLIGKVVLATWLMENKDYFSYLSNKQKSFIGKAIDETFNFQNARSLKQLVNPEKEHSIAYQLIVLPLKYAPALLRLTLSFFISTVALIAGRKHASQPIKNNIKKIWHMAIRDLSRLLVFGQHMSRLVYKVVKTPVKLFYNVLTMAVSFILGKFNLNVAHKFYQLQSWVHGLIDSAKNFLFPARAIKKELIAHPNYCLAVEMKSTYNQLNEQLGKSEVQRKRKKEGQERSDRSAPVHIQRSNRKKNKELLFKEEKTPENSDSWIENIQPSV